MSVAGLKARLARHEDLRHLFASGSGSIVVPLVNLACIPVILRLYGPSEYGLWVLLMSVTLIPGTISTLRYELAIVMADDDRQAGQVFSLCTLLVLACSGAAGLGFVCARPWISPELAPWAWSVPILVASIGFSLAATSWCTRAKAFGLSSASTVVRAVVMNVGQMLAPAAGLGGEAGLVIGSIAGYAAANALVVAGMLAPRAHEFRRGLRDAPAWGLMRRFRNFALFSVPYTFVGTIKQEGAKLVLGGFGGKALVGDYGFALRLTGFPAMMVSGGIRPVLYQKAARHAHVRETQPFLEATLYGLSLLTLPACIAFIVHAKPILRTVVGNDWIHAVPYAQILAVPALAFVHTNWMDRILDTLQRQRLALGLETTFALLGLVGLAVGLVGFRNPLVAVGAQSAIHTLSCIVFVIATYRAGGLEMRGLARYGLCFFGYAIASLALILVLDAVAPWLVAAAAGILLSYGLGVLLLRRMPGGGAGTHAPAHALPLPAPGLGQGGFPA